MLINDIRKSKWYNKKSKRLGRWNSSWKWNYSTRWIKWQLSRSWGWMPSWFEGWQTPLNQRLPKNKWFKRYYKLVLDYQVINLDQIQLDDRIKTGDKITKESLFKLWYIKNIKEKVKVLWRLKKINYFDKKLVFEWIDAFSSTAKELIIKAWWQII